MSTVKVKFKQKAYLPDPNNLNTSLVYYPTDQLPEGNDGIYTFPADYPLPTTDIEIVEGTSTYKKPADKSPEPVTQINPAVTKEAAKKSRAKSAG